MAKLKQMMPATCASGKPSIIEIKLDPEAITPTRTLTDIRNG